MNVHQHIQAELRKLEPDELRNWCEVHGLVENPPRLRVRFATMGQWTPAQRERVGNGLKNWCLKQDYADAVLRVLVSLDHRLGIWSACQVSRSVLHYIPESQRETLSRAVEAAERWARAKQHDSDLDIVQKAAFVLGKIAAEPARSAAMAALVPYSALMTSQWEGIGEAVRHALECLGCASEQRLRHPLVEVIANCIPDAINEAIHGYAIEQERRNGQT